jgi:hypothetical protein
MPDCSAHPITPKVVAIATDTYLKPKTPFADPVNLPGVAAPKYGQDIESGYKRAAPGGQSVGTSAADLKTKMRNLLTIFAAGDRTGMAKRLFDAFLQDTCRLPQYFDDASLATAAAKHQNIVFFCHAALSAPTSAFKSQGKTRIHQALKAANWDIAKMVRPADLGVPALNIGNKTFSTGDFNNGLGVMINGIQHAYVVATHYHHDASAGKYCIKLRYIFYDVFGLDDDDLNEFGASSDSWSSSTAAKGITAWWQLQHQYGYAPLVTRIRLEMTHEAPTT